STATPAACPISQLFGRGLGQNGSTSKTGAPPTEAETPVFIAREPPPSAFTNTSNARPATTVTAFRLIPASEPRAAPTRARREPRPRRPPRQRRPWGRPEDALPSSTMDPTISRRRDVSYQLHPFTNLGRHETEGPLV